MKPVTKLLAQIADLKLTVKNLKGIVSTKTNQNIDQAAKIERLTNVKICEWQEPNGHGFYKTGCGHNPLRSTYGGVYCCYCGGKIKALKGGE